MKIRRSLLKDQVTVKTKTGEGPYGPVYGGDPVDVRCNVDETRRMVRDAAGEQVVSEVTLHLHPQAKTVPADPAVLPETIDPVEAFATDSLVTVRTRTTSVLTTKPHTIRGKTVMVEVTCR